MTDDATPTPPGAAGPAPLVVGDPVPPFDLPGREGSRVRLCDFAGRPFVLYFYPKADTSGCTQQALAFQRELDRPSHDGGGLPVVGISRDPATAIARFARKHDLRFPLAGDEAGTVLQAFGVWVQKSMYGRSYMGIERTTVLVDANGRVAALWRRVKLPGHVEAVMQAAAELTAAPART